MKGVSIIYVSQTSPSDYKSSAGNIAGNSPAVAASVRSQAAPVELPGKAVQATASTPGAEQLDHAVQQVNKVVKSLSNSGLEFSVDKDTGIHVVKVVDTKTRDVIRQIPTEEVLAIAKTLDKLQGLIINQKA